MEAVRIVYKNFVKKKKGKKGYFFILKLEFRTNKKPYQKSLALRFLGYL